MNQNRAFTPFNCVAESALFPSPTWGEGSPSVPSPHVGEGLRVRGIFPLLLLALSAIAFATPVQAAEPEWKVGLARVKITPEQAVFLSGYSDRDHPFEKVTADLFAKALAIEDRNGQVAVLVTTDLIGLPAAVADPVCAQLAAKVGLKREQILLSSSHVHTGPALDMRHIPPDKRTQGDQERTVAYTRRLQELLVAVATQALAKREPASLEWGTGIANFVMNRREFTPNGVILGVNPRGHVDRTVPVLRIRGADGSLRAIVFGASTHNTTLTGTCYEVCGDYAGFAQSYLEDHHPGTQAMFVLGCAGDSNPHPRGTMEMARAHGDTLGKEVDRVLSEKMQPIRGPLRVAFGKVDAPLAPAPTRAEIDKMAARKGSVQAWVAGQMRAELDAGRALPTTYPVSLAVWQFGDDLTLVALSGEVVVDYVSMLEKALGPLKLWPVAYCNDLFGYLPSARVLSEGGYETRGLYAGGIGFFAPTAQDVIVAKVRELAASVGRKISAGEK